MSIRTLLLSIFILWQLQSFAQEQSSKINSPQASRYVLKATLSDLIWAADGILPIALEYKPHKRFGITGEVGIPLFYTIKVSPRQNKKTINNDIRLGADIRYYYRIRYTSRRGVFIQSYIGLQASQRMQNYTYPEGASVNDGGTLSWFSRANVFKLVSKANVIIGVQIPFSKRFFMSLQSGIGVKYVKQQFENYTSLTVHPIRTKEITIPIRNNEDLIFDSEGGFLNLPVAIRFCFGL